MAWRGMEQIIADEMALLPGMEELANLLYIVNYTDSGDYDVIIVDCAPTGETLRFLPRALALRSLIDRAVARVEEKEKAGGQGRTKIDIE